MELRDPERPFPVEYAALGLLIEAPRHGYELRERLRIGLERLWHVAASQLYSVLHRLEDKGWIDGRDETPDKRPTRTVYRVTPVGEQAFWRWVVEPVKHLRDLRIEFFVKVYLLRRVAPETIPSLFDAQIESLKELRARLRDQDRIDSDDDALAELALEYRRNQVANVIRWMRKHRLDFTSKEDDG
jgi:DNA-binding PadR family transcriptional regulator